MSRNAYDLLSPTPFTLLLIPSAANSRQVHFGASLAVFTAISHRGAHGHPMVNQFVHLSFLRFMNPFPPAKVLVISLQGHDFALWIIKFHAVSILLFHKVI